MKTQTLLALPAFSLATLVAQAQIGTEQATDPAAAVEPRPEVTPANPNLPHAGPLTIQPLAPAPLPVVPVNAGNEGLERLVESRLQQIEASIRNAPNAEAEEHAKAQVATLWQRREALRQNFDQEKLDQLVHDTRQALVRVSSWSSKRTTDETASPPGSGATVGSGSAARNDRTYAALNLPAAQALANIEVYRISPSPDNKDDVKTALRALDEEIDRLEDQADDLPRGEARDAAMRRVKALEDRESEIRRDFTKARWDALVADLRAEWAQLTR